MGERSEVGPMVTRPLRWARVLFSFTLLTFGGGV